MPQSKEKKKAKKKTKVKTERLKLNDSLLKRLQDNNRELTELHLDKKKDEPPSYNWSADPNMGRLMQILETNTTLKTLNLRSNQIKDAGAQALAPILERNRTLTKLSLSNNQITTKGAQALASALRNNHTLTELKLSKNHIDDKRVEEKIKAILERNKQHSTAWLGSQTTYRVAEQPTLPSTSVNNLAVETARSRQIESIPVEHQLDKLRI